MAAAHVGHEPRQILAQMTAKAEEERYDADAVAPRAATASTASASDGSACSRNATSPARGLQCAHARGDASNGTRHAGRATHAQRESAPAWSDLEGLRRAASATARSMPLRVSRGAKSSMKS